MSISIVTRQAYTEIDNFLELLNEDDRNKVPEELRKMFKKEKDSGYIKRINANVPISKQNLKEETLSLIALLNLHYWCDDESERERLKKVYDKNEKKYQELIETTFSVDDVFKGNKKQEETKEIIEENKLVKKEPFYLKIFNRIKIYLRINRK